MSKRNAALLLLYIFLNIGFKKQHLFRLLSLNLFSFWLEPAQRPTRAPDWLPNLINQTLIATRLAKPGRDVKHHPPSALPRRRGNAVPDVTFTIKTEYFHEHAHSLWTARVEFVAVKREGESVRRTYRAARALRYCSVEQQRWTCWLQLQHSSTWHADKPRCAHAPRLSTR